MSTVLTWVERALVAAGVVLAAWCAAVLVEARFTDRVPVQAPLKVTQTLPDGTPAPSPARRAPVPTPAAPAPAAGTVIARLELPRLHLSAPVLEGSDDATLSRGAGHIEDTPLPGEPGNVGIAGHRDTVFRALRNAKVGDELALRTGDRLLRYRVARTLIVKPEDVYVLDPTTTPTLTLVTCYPFQFIGHAPKRFIIQAQLENTGTSDARLENTKK